MKQKPKATCPVRLGQIYGVEFYFSNLAVFAKRSQQGTLPKGAHYFVAIGYHATFSPGGQFTKMVQSAYRRGMKFTMCLNCPVSFAAFRRRFPEKPCCYVSELFFFYLRHNYGDVFSVAQTKKKEFDAVMIASRLPCKNRDLAADIPNLANIMSAYIHEQELAIPNAKYTNDRFLSRSEINEIFSNSQVAMILSYVEGANRSTLEYLLAGLPVVSTQSKGGRDVFFDSENSIIVLRKGRTRAEIRDEVTKAFRELLRRKVDGEVSGEKIRETALGRLHWFFENLLHGFSFVLDQEISEIAGSVEKLLVEHAPSFREVIAAPCIPPSRMPKNNELYFFPQ